MGKLVTICIVALCAVLISSTKGDVVEEGIGEIGTQRVDWSRAAMAPILTPAQLDSAIVARMNEFHINGVSVAIVMHDSIVWTNAYGYANAKQTVPVTSSTLFTIASTSKSILTTGVLQLWEHGRIDLDANVNDYLPFTIRNPYYPNVPITIRMILGHVSSVTADHLITEGTACGGYPRNYDSPVPMQDCLYGILNEHGSSYTQTNYLNFVPGTQGMYSTTAICLLGLVIEHVTGLPLEQYCQDSIWNPLGMNETSWYLANLDTSHLAQPCEWNGFYTTRGHPGFAAYAGGRVKTSAPQLARHLSSFLERGIVKGVRVLDGNTVDSIMNIQYPGTDPLYECGAFAAGISEYGLGWYHIYLDEPLWAWGHSGHIPPGIVSHMYGVPTEHTGAIMLTNSDYDWDGIWDTYLLIWAFSRDKDQDGIIAGLDNCLDLANPGQGDADQDGVGDACDNCTDSDSDGFGNPGFAGNTCAVDNCPFTSNPDQTDSDGDGIGDACDNCPGLASSDQSDADSDGIGDLCDNCTDTDSDGFGNPGFATNTCAVDNCPTISNPTQADANSDGIGDACCCVSVTGNVNYAGIVDLSDLSSLVSYLTGGGYVLPCPNESNVNATGIVDLSDLSSLVSYLTGGGYQLPSCL